MKKHSLLLILLFVSTFLMAQNADDAVLYSQTFYEGTARSNAMGNATGAMGGDFTATCINPAGLGIYRSDELTFSTGFQHTKINSTYYNEQHGGTEGQIFIPNFAMVFTAECSNYKPLRYMQFALGMTRTNDLNFTREAHGFNPYSSRIDDYLQQLGDQGLDNPEGFLEKTYPFDIFPAWETYLIDRYMDSLGNYYYSSPIPQGNLYQTDRLESSGRSEEWSMAFSANYFDKLFLGASVNSSHIKRVSTHKYIEETPGDDIPNWNSTEELKSTGWSVNMKLGAIYFPCSWLRIGAAWHTRTFYTFDESYSTETEAISDHGYYRHGSGVSYYDYDFDAPNKAVGSLAFLIGQHGMITTDFDYVDYRKGSFSSTVYDYDYVNADIQDILRPSYNIRVGTEWRLRQYYLRGGAAYYGSPYGFGNAYGSAKKASIGIGYASGESIWDFCYELTRMQTGTYPYLYYEGDDLAVEEILQHWMRNKFVVTWKVKF